MQVEAMGLPSIVTNINACNEIIEEDINGKIIPGRALYEAMKELTEVENRRMEMSKVSRKLI